MANAIGRLFLCAGSLGNLGSLGILGGLAVVFAYLAPWPTYDSQPVSHYLELRLFSRE